MHCFPLFKPRLFCTRNLRRFGSFPTQAFPYFFVFLRYWVGLGGQPPDQEGELLVYLQEKERVHLTTRTKSSR